MTAIPTSIDRAVDTPVPAGGLRAVGIAGGLVAVALAAASLGADELVVGSWVRAALVALWGLAAVVVAMRTSASLATVIAGAAVAGGVCTVTAASADLTSLHAAASCLIPATALHVELVIPDGSIGRPARRNLAIAGYVVAALIALVMVLGDRVPAVPAVAAATTFALLIGLPAAHQTYQRSAGLARQRLQLVGCAVAVIVEVALVVAALNVLVDWPSHAAEVAAAATGLVPLALAAGTSPRISRRVDRVLVHTVSATGLTAVVVAVYLVIVIGLGRTPDDTERNLLVLSMLAAAIASLAYVPARERLAETANRLVYGERHPPDEVLRTWGSRLSRSIPMDELLLQLAESLRKVLVLRRAEIWTGHARLASSWRCRCPTAPRRPCTSAPRSSRSSPGPASPATPGSRCGCPPSSRTDRRRSCGSRRRRTPASCSACS